MRNQVIVRSLVYIFLSIIALGIYSSAGGFIDYRLKVVSINTDRLIVQIENRSNTGVACMINTSNDKSYFFDLRKKKTSRSYSVRLPVKWIDFGCKN